MIDMILFPSSYFSITKVDEDLQTEYDAVVNTGLFDIAIFGYGQWFNEGKLVLHNAPTTMQTTVYRGWMMRPEQDEESFFRALNQGFKAE